MSLLRIAVLHDPDFEPALPTLPVTRAMRVLAMVSIRDRYVDLLRIALPNVIVADLREWPEQTGRIIANLRAASPLADPRGRAPARWRPRNQALARLRNCYVTRDTCGGVADGLDAIATAAFSYPQQPQRLQQIWTRPSPNRARIPRVERSSGARVPAPPRRLLAFARPRGATCRM